MANLYRLLGLIVTRGVPPLELDHPFYRLVHDDLASMDDTTLTKHFAAYGRDESRIASPAAHRNGLVALVPRYTTLLEIGPFTKPVFRGGEVFYFDVLNQKALVERARAHGQPTEGCPEIDYVSPTGDPSVVDRTFASALSSNCIEHQPDLVAHLQAVGRILDAGGRYFMMIPDKRYCFDHFLPESTLADVILAHSERRHVHAIRSVHEHAALTTYKEAPHHWAGDHTDPRAHLVGARAAKARVDFEAAKGGYLDVHAWQFTPASFQALLRSLADKGLTSFVPERVYETIHHKFEIAAILKKSKRHN